MEGTWHNEVAGYVFSGADLTRDAKQITESRQQSRGPLATLLLLDLRLTPMLLGCRESIP